MFMRFNGTDNYKGFHISLLIIDRDASLVNFFAYDKNGHAVKNTSSLRELINWINRYTKVQEKGFKPVTALYSPGCKSHFTEVTITIIRPDDTGAIKAVVDFREGDKSEMYLGDLYEDTVENRRLFKELKEIEEQFSKLQEKRAEKIKQLVQITNPFK